MKERYNLTLNPKIVDKVDKLARLEGKSRSNFVDSYHHYHGLECKIISLNQFLDIYSFYSESEEIANVDIMDISVDDFIDLVGLVVKLQRVNGFVEYYFVAESDFLKLNKE